ncbi:MAG TPA: VOC family protein [Bacteroidales bacterium]|nr:VOC family protein [Bacteroidales bacterium]
MTKEFWINLPVKDIKRSKDFYTQLGFSFRPLPGNREDGVNMVLGSKDISVMLFEEPMFRNFSDNEVADTAKGSEVLFSIDAEDIDEVNSIASKIGKAGGKIYSEPGEREGWMYGCGFIDPDGHRWSVLYMDESKMPKQKAELQVP